MGFAVIQVTEGHFGEELDRRGLATNLPTREAAEREAERRAKEHESHGYNDERGHWWYRESGKVNRLIVE